MKWVSVKDMLPDKDYKGYLAVIYQDTSYSGEGTEIGWLDKNGEIYLNTCRCCRNDVVEITHWMPLPEAPDVS